MFNRLNYNTSLYFLGNFSILILSIAVYPTLMISLQDSSWSQVFIFLTLINVFNLIHTTSQSYVQIEYNEVRLSTLQALGMFPLRSIMLLISVIPVIYFYKSEISSSVMTLLVIVVISRELTAPFRAQLQTRISQSTLLFAQITNTLVRLILVLLLVLLDLTGAIYFCSVYLISYLAEFLYVLVVSRNSMPKELTPIETNTKLYFSLLIANMSGIFFTQIDKVLSYFFSDSIAFTGYSINSIILFQIFHIANAFIVVYSPKVRFLFKQSQNYEVSNILTYFLSLNVAVSLIAVSFLMDNLESLFELIGRDASYFTEATFILQSAVAIIFSSSWILSCVLNNTGRASFVRTVSAVSVLFAIFFIAFLQLLGALELNTILCTLIGVGCFQLVMFSSQSKFNFAIIYHDKYLWLALISACLYWLAANLGILGLSVLSLLGFAASVVFSVINRNRVK